MANIPFDLLLARTILGTDNKTLFSICNSYPIMLIANTQVPRPPETSRSMLHA